MRLKSLEKKSPNVKKIDDSENIKNASIEDQILKCPSCDFTSKSKHGLRIHIQRMHTDVNFSKTCSLCDKTFNTYNKFRDHKFEHTNWNKKQTAIPVKNSNSLEIICIHLKCTWG